MPKLSLSLLKKIEFFCLLALAFFLPMLEAPKNIFWFAYVVFWTIRCFKAGDFGGRWRASDTAIAILWLSCLIGATMAGIHGEEWGGFSDVTRYITLLWCVSRAGYTSRQWQQLTAVLAVATILTLGYGAWLYYVTKQRAFLELYSVGHVNHTAVYLGVLCGILLAALLGCWSIWAPKARGLVVLALALVFAGLLIGSSRGAIGAVLLMVLVLGVAWLPKSRRPLQAIIVALIGIALIAIAGNFGVVEKQRRGLEANDPLSHRDTIWRRALIITEIYPVFGAGMNNFGKVDDAAIARQVTADGDTYETARYLGANHAHNLYLNTLAERGVVGAGVFCGIFLACLIMLIRRRPKAADNAYLWAAWGASLAAWIVVVMAGMFNTSFHHEIALLAVLPLGAWISFTRGAEV